jgi:hypothetical protein
MRTGFRILSLVPGGLVFDSVSDSTDSTIFFVRSETAAGNCPLCGVPSRRVHSRYLRCVADLPCAGREVRFRMITRRFVCKVPHCRRRIFAERFRDDVVPIRARRTVRLERIVHHLGLALGGRPAAGFAKVSRRSDAAHQRQVALIFASGHNCMVLKLGIDVGQTTVVKYMPRGGATARRVDGPVRGSDNLIPTALRVADPASRSPPNPVAGGDRTPDG